MQSNTGTSTDHPLNASPSCLFIYHFLFEYLHLEVNPFSHLAHIF